MKIYCIELERGGIGEEDLTLHHGFEKEPTKQEVLDYIMSQDIGFDEKYCEFNFYHVADEAKGKTALIPTLQLTPFEQTKENLIALASDYKNMVVTKDNMKEANEARLVLYRKRIEIQNVAKANRKTIKEFLKNNNDATEEELIGTIEPTELALEAKIKAIKDAIAEEERIEATRIAKHKATLDNISNETVKATNSIDMLYLKAINDTVLTDLEEFTAEGEQLLSALKETAKNRLELLEFQAKKKADEEAEAKRIADEEKAQQEAELAEKRLRKAIEDPFSREGSVELDIKKLEAAELAVIEDAKFDGSKHDWIKNEEVAFHPPTPSEAFEPIEAPKLSPLKTVPIGAVSGTTPDGFSPKFKKEDDKDKLRSLSVWIKDVDIPNFYSDTAIKHGEYIQNMLSKLSEQTLKVAEKL